MKKSKRLGELLEFPREIISNIPKLTIVGFDEILIENFISILEYEDFFVKIKTSIGNININGIKIKLNQIGKEDINVSGIIDNIDFEPNKNV